MSLPTHVRIVGRVYDIVVKEELAGLWGQCDYDKLRIDIKQGQLPLLEADTLLHEVVHAIDDVMQTKMTERQVHCIATGLIALLKDNQEFLEYLYKATKE